MGMRVVPVDSAWVWVALDLLHVWPWLAGRIVDLVRDLLLDVVFGPCGVR